MELGICSEHLFRNVAELQTGCMLYTLEMELPTLILVIDFVLKIHITVHMYRGEGRLCSTGFQLNSEIICTYLSCVCS